MFGTARHLSFRHRFLRWRARFSIPSLLAGFDERKVISIACAVQGGVAILIIGGLAWLVDLPLLFPALGPSAFLLFSSPFSPAAAPRSVIVGHMVGIATGFVIWCLTSLVWGQPVRLDDGGWLVFASASLALGLTCALLVRLSCPHAPACASAIIVALGAVAHWSELVGMVVGVVLLTGQAVLLNRIAGVKTPGWCSPVSNDSD
jgi:CBS-domain-containing membrane protein